MEMIILMSVFLEQIKQLINNDELTPKEKYIAEYVMNNLKEASKLNMEELATKTNTSTGTVLRFAQKKLGLKGFSELKEKLILEKSINSYEKEVKEKFEENTDDFYKNIAAKILNTSYTEINKIIGKTIFDISVADIYYLYNNVLNLYDNLVIYDNSDRFGYSFSNLLAEQNYIHILENNPKKCKEKIISSHENSETKMSKLKDFLNRKNYDKLKENVLRNKLILIDFKNSENVNDIIKEAINNDFLVLKISNNNNYSNEGDYYSINLGELKVNDPMYLINSLSPYLFLELMSVYYQKNVKHK
jgi:hypothetical protein